jgi:hypothetical protein
MRYTKIGKYEYPLRAMGVAALAGVLAAVLFVVGVVAAAEAKAAPAPPPSASAPHARAAIPPLCVTTTWRARHTHQPKTRPGAVCLLTEDMWMPSRYEVLGVFATGHWYDVRRFVALVVRAH